MNLESMQPKKAKQENKEENFNDFLEKIKKILNQDDNIDFCYSFNSSLKEQANNLIDFKDSDSFKNNLIILEKIEIFYENLLYAQSHSGQIKQTELDKYQITKLISENIIKTEDGDANALLSLYLKAIKNKKHIDNYGPYQETIDFRKIIAPGRLAQIPLDYESDFNYKITSINHKEDIIDLDQKQKDYFKQIKDLQEVYKKEFNYDLAFKSDADSRLYFLKNNKKNIISDNLEEEITLLKKIVKLEKQENKLFSQNLYKLENFDLRDFFINNSSDYEKLASFLEKIWSNNTLSNEIKDSLGLSVTDFSITEQAYILDFLKNAKNKDLPIIKEFSEKFKENGFRTFLSIEHGGKEMGDKILALSEKLPEDSAKILFQTYSDIVDATEEVGQILQENLKDKATPELINSSKETLLIAGKNLLEKYSKKASTCEGLDCETLGEELKERLALAKKSVFAFSYACKTLVENGQFSFEDFEKVKLSYEKSPLAEDIKNQIIEMHKENTKQYPEKLREVWRETLKDGLLNSNEKQLVVYVSYEKDIVSAMRVIEQEDGSWYGASFNVNPTVQGSKVGSELLKKVLNDLAKDKPFVADCYSKNPMLDTYLNKFGFKITKEIENYHDTGELVYEITLYKEEV